MSLKPRVRGKSNLPANSTAGVVTPLDTSGNLDFASICLICVILQIPLKVSALPVLQLLDTCQQLADLPHRSGQSVKQVLFDINQASHAHASHELMNIMLLELFFHQPRHCNIRKI